MLPIYRLSLKWCSFVTVLPVALYPGSKNKKNKRQVCKPGSVAHAMGASCHLSWTAFTCCL